MAGVWYFAYGSNMNTGTLCGRRGIRFRQAFSGCVPGWRVVFDKPPVVAIGESFANIVRDAEATAYGVLYEISSADFAHVELTEGVRIGNYERVELCARSLHAAAAVEVAAFSFTSGQRDDSLQPSRRYMDVVIAGAREHGLPACYVEYLRSIPARPESREAAELRPFVDLALRRDPS